MISRLHERRLLAVALVLTALLGCERISALRTQQSAAVRVNVNNSIVWIARANGEFAMGFLVGYPRLPKPGEENPTAQRELYAVTAWHNIASGGPLRILRWGESGEYRTAIVYPETVVIRVDHANDLAILRLDQPLLGHQQDTGFRLGARALQFGTVYEAHELVHPPRSSGLQVNHVPRMTAECRLLQLSDDPLQDPIWPGVAGRREVTSATITCRRDINANAVGGPLVLDDEVVGVLVADEAPPSAEPVFRVVPADALIELVAAAHTAAHAPRTLSDAQAREAIEHELQDIWNHYLPDQATVPLSDVIDREDVPNLRALATWATLGPTATALEVATLVDVGGVFHETMTQTMRVSPRLRLFGSATRSDELLIRTVASDWLRARLLYDPQHPPDGVVIAPRREAVAACGNDMLLVRFRVATQEGRVCAQERYGQWTLRHTVDPSTDRSGDFIRSVRARRSWQIATSSLQPNAPDVSATMLNLELSPRSFDTRGHVETFVSHLYVDGHDFRDFQCVWRHDRIVCQYAATSAFAPPLQRWNPWGFALWLDPHGQAHVIFIDMGARGYTLRHGLLTPQPS